MSERKTCTVSRAHTVPPVSGSPVVPSALWSMLCVPCVAGVCENSAILTDSRYSETMPLYLSPTRAASFVPGKSPRPPTALPVCHDAPTSTKRSSPRFSLEEKRGCRGDASTCRRKDASVSCGHFRSAARTRGSSRGCRCIERFDFVTRGCDRGFE